MLNKQQVQEYWQEQTKRGENPCHYHDKWQDRYAYTIRTSVYKKGDFEGAKRIVDVGCGIGDYTTFFSQMCAAKFIGFDFPFNIAIAKKKYVDNPRLEFYGDPLPSERLKGEVESADIALTTTVYVHLAREAREAFLRYVGGMKREARVILLEYAPDTIPPFQKGIPYKEVETPAQIVRRMEERGFRLKERRAVNCIDSFLFFHLGKNFFTYFLTLWSDRFLRAVRYPKSKYKLFIFEKT
jgi:SAM-dependent methyltransferase